jgi:hypothetical protein
MKESRVDDPILSAVLMDEARNLGGPSRGRHCCPSQHLPTILSHFPINVTMWRGGQPLSHTCLHCTLQKYLVVKAAWQPDLSLNI